MVVVVVVVPLLQACLRLPAPFSLTFLCPSAPVSLLTHTHTREEEERNSPISSYSQ